MQTRFPALLGVEPLPTPADYDDYWGEAREDARRHPIAMRRDRVETGLAVVEVFDVSFAGAHGREVRGWLRLPRNRRGPTPAVVHANGYGAGRLLPIDDLTWASAGFAHLVVDTHGQGGGSTGHLVDGITEPSRYYYRDVFIDVMRGIDAIRSLDEVDPTRTAMVGNSQGGGIALGVGALVPDLTAVLAQAPFLTDAPTALQEATTAPWTELRAYLLAHPDRTERVAQTLAYVDGVTSARHATAPGWISAGDRDETSPPATARRAAAAYAGAVTFHEWPDAGHEAGGTRDRAAALEVLHRLFGTG